MFYHCSGVHNRDFISHLRDYADDHLLPMLERAGEIDDEGFDWGLNDIED